MTAREIAEAHLMQWDAVRTRKTMPEFMEAAVADGIREGARRAAEILDERAGVYEARANREVGGFLQYHDGDVANELCGIATDIRAAAEKVTP